MGKRNLLRAKDLINEMICCDEGVLNNIGDLNDIRDELEKNIKALKEVNRLINKELLK